MRKKLALFLCVFTIMSALIGCGSKKPSGGETAVFTNRAGSAVTATDIDEVEEVEEAPTEVQEQLYIVEAIDMADESIIFYQVNGAREVRYSYTMTTKFLDKYGNSSSTINFIPGTVVVLGDLLPASGALGSVQMADSVWKYEDITKFKIDADSKTFSIGQDNFKLTKATKLFSDTDRITLRDISQEDVLTVTGQGNNVLSISVTTGHGYIQLSNTGLFKDSLIFIGGKIVSMIYGDATIEVPEGTYDITVANDGWGGTGKYTVVRNEITEVDLDDLKGEGPSYCELTFVVTVPGTYVYIDGEIIDTDNPVDIRYGSHKLLVSCDGYKTWQKTLVVNSASATISLELEANSNSSTENNSNNNTSTNNETVNNSSTNTTTNNTSGGTTNESTTSNPNNTTNTTNSTDNNGSNTPSDYEIDYLSTLSQLIGTLLEN